MASAAGGVFVRGFRQLLEPGTVAGLTESQVIARFVESGDPVAFEAIIRRHGPMVLALCRQMLRDANDVDDAFQATFLILVRKAGTLRQRDRLGPWLYGVAYRVAHRVRTKPRSRELPEDCATQARDCPLEEREQLEALHDEIQRLPAKYRLPVVLCGLEGLTHDEAARQLGWPVGTVHGRLARARDQLKSRLARRGIGPRAHAVDVLALLQPLKDAVPETLARATVALVSGPVAIRLETLINGVLFAMLTGKLKMIALSCAVATLGVISTASVLLACHSPRTKTAASANLPIDATVGQPVQQDAAQVKTKEAAPLFKTPPGESNDERIERELVALDQLQVQAELLELDIEIQRNAITMQKDRIMTHESWQETPSSLTNEQARAAKIENEKTLKREKKDLEQAIEAYAHSRIELGKLLRRIKRDSHALGAQPSHHHDLSDTGISQRLDRLEEKVDRLIMALPMKGAQ